MMKMWPPSRIGIGIRFSRPRFRLIDAIRLNSAIHPSCADSPDSCAIATGPISCFGDVSPREQAPQRLEDQPADLDVLLDAQLDRLERARLEAASYRRRMPTPIQPMLPRLTGVTDTSGRRAVAQNRYRDRLFGMLARSCRATAYENVIGCRRSATIDVARP